MRALETLLKEAGLVKQADRTGVHTTHWFWASDVFMKQAKPEVVDGVEPLPAADAEAQKLLVAAPNMPAATMLNALKSKGIKLVDEKAAMEADGSGAMVAVTRAGAKALTKESSPVTIHTTAQLKETTVTKNAGVGPIRFKVALIQEGLGNLRDAFFYSKDAIRSGIQAFEGRKCFADHPARSEEQDRPERSVRDIIGHFENVAMEENEDGSLALVGELVMPPDPPFEWARALVRQAAAYNKKYPEQSFVGLSINASGDAHEVPYDDFVKTYDLPESCKPKLMAAREAGMDTVKMVSAIKDAVSCDLVTEPGAKGKVIDILESEETMKAKQAEKKAKIEAEEEKKMPMKQEAEDEAVAKSADDEATDAEKADAEDHEDVEQDKKLILDMIKKHMGEEEIEGEAEAAAMEAYEAYKEMGESEDEAMKCAGKAMKLAKHMAAKRMEAEKCEAEKKEADAKDEDSDEAPKKESAVKLEARIAFLERELKKRELAESLDSKLKESGLGRAETDRLRKLIGEPKSEAEIEKTIKIFKEAYGVRGESAKSSGFFVTGTEKAAAPVKKSKVSFGDCR